MSSRLPSTRAIAIVFAAGAFFGSAATGLTAGMLGSALFSDVPAGSYYDAPVGRMYDAGIMKGSDGKFRPTDFVTRAELATVMDRIVNGDVEVSRSSSSRSRSSSSSSTSSSSSSSSSVVTTEAGNVHFTTAAFSISNKVQSLTVSVIRSGGSKGAVNVDYTFNGGTAVSEKDYNPATGTISFKDGETSKILTLRVLTNASAPASVTVNLTLSNPTGGLVLANPSTAVITILNSSSTSTTGSSSSYTSVSSAAGGTFAFGALGYATEEKTGKATLTVSRTGNTSAAANIDYATADGSAKGGTQYSPTSGTLNFGVGESSKTITVTLTDNTSIDGNKAFTVTLKNPTGGANVGYPATSTVTIVDDEAVSTGSGTIQFSTDAYIGNESDGSAVIIVNRTGSTSGSASVSYSTSDGTGIAGSDYTATSGTLSFAAGEGTKFFVVPLTKDSTVEDEERVNLLLSGVSGAQLGSQATATLKIR
jgi:hypothetical protein